jgi:L-alanine-DL-glutamate epimerase-like enolase superfamily enzyme
MQINKVDIYTLKIPYHIPTEAPIGILTGADNVVIKITTDTGLEGWGEASPFGPITGDTQASNYSMAQTFGRLLIGKDPLGIEARMAQLNRHTTGEPSIRSAFDMALYDLAAKAANMPLYQFLGGEVNEQGMHREIRTDLTIGMKKTVEETLSHAKDILAAGFDSIKMKVGRADLADIEHVQAVRDLAGPKVAIKIDSNQGWDYPTAVATIKAMAPLNLQYTEQPLAVWDMDNLARLRNNVDLPICVDETVFDHRDAFKVVKQGAADYINIKLGKSGGIHTALKINAIAEAAGCKCMIGCFAESRLALSAAAHLAVAKPNIHFLDLDSAYKLAEDPVLGGMQYDKAIGGRITLPSTPGLGAAFDEAAIRDQMTVS